MSDERREVHEAANIFPRLSMDDLAELADDIEANGLHDPIELLDGKIIDGRNREIACRIAGVEPEYIDVKITDPVAYVMSKNLHRRHLTTGQRAMVAAKMKELYATQAKERQRLSAGRGKKKVGKDCHTNRGKARDQAGKALNVSGVSVDKAAKVLAKGNPELVKAVTSGEVSLEKAVKRVTGKPRPPVDPVRKSEIECEKVRRQVKSLHEALWSLNVRLKSLKVEQRQCVADWHKLCSELDSLFTPVSKTVAMMNGVQWSLHRERIEKTPKEKE